MKKLYQKLADIWLSISLKQKLGVYTVVVVLVLGLSVIFNVQIMEYAQGSFSEILDDNAKCHDFQEAIELEAEAFETYVRNRNESNWQNYVLCCVRSERCINSLPFEYEKIGRERYARTWNVKNAYEKYRESREEFLSMNVLDENYIASLYRIYSMQQYIRDYAKSLVQVTFTGGNNSYQAKIPMFRLIPYVILIFSCVLVVLLMFFSRIFSNTLVKPLVKLAHCSRKIANNDFSGTDLQVSNRDELGELVQAFNKMKHATEGYINTLKKNNEMAELLHKEELERMDMEKQLDTARLELLKSQINPHFLFNTLNMIGCMAKLEDAETTETMIYSMSSLFRYTLKTTEQTVPLAREMKVVEEYIYIQKMRFGSRIQYESSIEVDPDSVMIPAFSLQPVVENAILHGLSKKEQGGRLYLRVWTWKKNLIISVADTGLGMSSEILEALNEALGSRSTSRVGIGLGNIYKRIRTMYKNGDMKIYSRPNCGTVVQMVIPQNENGGEE